MVHSVSLLQRIGQDIDRLVNQGGDAYVIHV
jgi:hypothetical protein